MTPSSHPALDRFLEARSAQPGRASGGSALDHCRALTDLLDAAVREVVDEAAGPAAPFAVIAVGGSGRREQCRHSDIDLMVLTPDRFDGEPARCLYPLWDAGLKVGHSIRTVDEALRAADHIETFTALLDARLVHGDPALFERFRGAWQRLVRGKREWLREELATRHEAAKISELWQVMAVDLKQSRGGLRDLQAAHWLDVAAAIAGGQPPPALSATLAEAQETLLQTRRAVHALNDRPTDIYRPENAVAVAEWLDVDRVDWGRTVALAMREVDTVASARLAAPPPARRWWSRWRAPEAPRESPAETGDETQDGVRGDLDDLLDRLRTAGPGGALEPLPPAPWLERLLPEWESLRARPHIAPFHVNPVDVHIVRCVAEANRALVEDDLATGTPDVAAEFGRPDEVRLAAFLHDVGKGHSGDHSEAGAVIAERFAARAGIDAAARRRLVTAVRQHLLLPAVATRRDIADEEVIGETATLVGDVDTLRLLYLLAVADARSSGPNVWSDWKAELLRRLYQRLLAVLDASGDGAAVTVEAVVEALASRLPAEAVRAHVDGMGADYLLSTAPATIGDHIELIAAAGERTAVHHDRVGEVDRVTVVTADRSGLLQAISGALAGQHASVLGGVAYTRRDGIAIQVWHIRDALNSGFDERRRQRLLDAIPAALEGALSVEARLAEIRAAYPDAPRADTPTRIHLDNASSRAHTILEVTTADRRGLLYAVTRALFEQGIDIHLAKVDTIGPEVVDAFYIRRSNGRRIEDADEQARLREAVADAIAALDES